LDSQPTINMAAYELYLKGRGAFQARNNSRDLLAVVQPLFTQSVKLDPGFAQAWVWLARVHIRIYNTIDHSAARLAQAKQCIDTAVKLAPEEPDVMLGLGNYYEITNDLPKATKLYQQVVQSFPNNAEALNYLGSESRKQARWGEALALLHKAQTLDPRSAPILQNLARMLVALRRYEELAKVNQVLMEVMGGAGTLLDAYSWAMTPYYAHGSTEAVETLVAGLTPAVRHTAANAIIVCGQWAYTKGDAAGLIRLWEEAGPDWHFSPVNERYDLISVASAFLKLGEASRARPLLEKNRELLVAQLATRPERIMAWDDLALTHAMLGEKAAALGILSKIQTLAQQASTPPSPGQRLDLAQVYAWLGQKDQAVAELTAALHQPGPPEFGNVHVLRTAIIWWPLQGDPAFEALLNDLANNTPLL
jgi:tetratricopeptide (TPR) repeat protein